MTSDSVDVLLVGAGIMSTSLGVFLKQLKPDLAIEMVERMPQEAQESSGAWNNAGTGHAGNCELNFTPMRKDGTVDIATALEVNVEFDLSRQFWAYLVGKGLIASADSFIHPVPHMSFVMGSANQAFLKKRHALMSAHHCYQGMEYSEDHAKIAEWVPLVMEGRDSRQPVAATHIGNGADVNYGALTSNLLAVLRKHDDFKVHFNEAVIDLHRNPEGGWRVIVRNEDTASERTIHARFVFLGAGGAALTLLQKSGIPESHGYAGFPVSGVWLRCDKPEVVNRHCAKVYGKAATGSPPMSVPHLDTRIIEGKRWLLSGPYAGFSTKFLKHGSYCDLPRSLRLANILPMLSVAKDNFPLEEYLVGQVLQSKSRRFKVLRQYYPDVNEDDWELAVAGQRVQIIKRENHYAGQLEFGTEIVASSDGTLVALLGASPGASTATFIMVTMIETVLREDLTGDWREKMKEIIPSYGHDLKLDAALLTKVRAETAAVLGLHPA
ncbi:malate dehydrogenase (quinone) [Cyanobium sp. FGCU-52]|nr:malate dehydrogenase (quinone) [Cyanobium sp. FGCU52]